MNKRLWAIAISLFAFPVFPVRAQWQAIPSAVAACSANPMVCATVAVGAGWVLYYRNHPPIFVPYPQSPYSTRQPRPSRMIDDPDAETHSWEYDTFANSHGEAAANCERIAETMTRNGGTLVRSVGARQVKGKLFKCQLVSEVSHGGR